MGANPHANGGLLMKDLRLPDFRNYRGGRAEARYCDRGIHARPGLIAARCNEAESASAEFPYLRSGRDGFESSERGVRGHGPRFDGEILPTDDHVCARRPRDGGV